MAPCKKMRGWLSSLSPALWMILILSLVIGLTGLRWGAPNLWHPDELFRVVLTMGQNLDPNPHYHTSPTLPVYFFGAMLIPYYIYLMLFNPGLIASLSSLPYSADSLSAVPPEFMVTAIVIIRLASVIASLALIIVVYLTAERAFGKKQALLSCAVLSLTPLFITYSKFATGYMFLVLFQWTSLLFQQRYLEKGNRRYLVIAAVFSGLAMASKYIGVFGVVFLAVTVLLKERPRKVSFSCLAKSGLVKAVVIAGLVFLVANPWPILDFSGFMAWAEHDHIFDIFGKGWHAFQWNPSPTQDRGWSDYPVLAMRAVGFPLFIMFIAGAFLIGHRLLKKRRALDSRQLMQAQLLFFALSYYLLLAPLRNSLIRLVILVLPCLAIFAAHALLELSSARRLRVLCRAAVLLVFLLSASIAAMTLCEFIDDTRYTAAEWLDENVQPGDSLGYFSQQVVYLPPFPSDAEPVYLDYIHDLPITGEELSSHFQELADSGPDYLALTSFFYARFSGPVATQRSDFYDELLEGRHPVYTPVARFEQHELFGYRPNVDFVSPTLVILKRQA